VGSCARRGGVRVCGLSPEYAACISYILCAVANLSSDELAIVETVREFVDREVRPVVRELEHNNTYPEKLIEQMKEMGIFGLAIPEPWGEAPVSMPCYALVTTELARGWMSLAGAMGGHTVVSKLLLNFGTQEQKDHYLPKMATGEIRTSFPSTIVPVRSLITIFSRRLDSTVRFSISARGRWISSNFE